MGPFLKFNSLPYNAHHRPAPNPTPSCPLGSRQDDSAENVSERAHILETMAVTLRSKPVSYIERFVDKEVGRISHQLLLLARHNHDTLLLLIVPFLGPCTAARYLSFAACQRAVSLNEETDR